MNRTAFSLLALALGITLGRLSKRRDLKTLTVIDLEESTIAMNIEDGEVMTRLKRALPAGSMIERSAHSMRGEDGGEFLHVFTEKPWITAGKFWVDGGVKLYVDSVDENFKEVFGD